MAKERPIDLALGDELPLGSRIRLRRRTKGTQLSTMARDLGYDRGYLSHVENNRVKPSEELLQKIADYLNTTAENLKQGPIQELAIPSAAQADPALQAFGLVNPALPLQMPSKRRTVGQRIERLLAMAHLSEEEQEIVEDHLAEVASAELAFFKTARHSRSGD